MCEGCGKAVVHQFAERRAFLKLILTAPAGFACHSYAVAQVNKVAPKPENVLTPDAALDRLMKGNARYVEGVSRRHDFNHEREPLRTGQNPFAATTLKPPHSMPGSDASERRADLKRPDPIPCFGCYQREPASYWMRQAPELLGQRTAKCHAAFCSSSRRATAPERRHSSLDAAFVPGVAAGRCPSPHERYHAQFRET